MEIEQPVMLLVEDNADHAELLLANFAQHRAVVDVRLIEDGEAALDYLLRRGRYANPPDSPRPHLILLDLRLPKIDGLDVLRTIKQHPALRAIPVVVLSTSDTRGDVLGAYDANVNSYLVKPVSFEGFRELTRTLDHYWLGWNRLPPV